MLLLTQAILVGFVAFGVAVYVKKKTKESKKLPPGPWGLPIVGHLLFFGSNPAKKFVTWKKKYGSIFTVKFGSFRTNYRAVVLNDMQSIQEAYSMPEFLGRPPIPVFNKASLRRGIVFSDGPKLDEQHSFMVKVLKEFVGSKSMESRMQEEVELLLKDLERKTTELNGKPMKMNNLVKFVVGNSLWDLVLGERFDENDFSLTRLMKLLDEGLDSNSTIFAQLFWFFPWFVKIGNLFGFDPAVESFKKVSKFMQNELNKLEHVPGARKHFSDAYFDKVAETTDPNSSFHESGKYYLQLWETIPHKTNTVSKKLLKKQMQQQFVIADLFTGATETTIKSMDWLLIYMAQSPEIQRKLQQEIDMEIGINYNIVPRLAHRARMPYTNAVIEEILRLSSVAPFGVYHSVTEDLTFHDYFIAKDTIIIGNLYAANHDPILFDNPEKFDPNRFLLSKGQSEKVKNITFSFGKRACPGEGFARDLLFLLVTNFFRKFTVSNTRNLPCLEPVFNVAVYPLPFELYVDKRY